MEKEEYLSKEGAESFKVKERARLMEMIRSTTEKAKECCFCSRETMRLADQRVKESYSYIDSHHVTEPHPFHTELKNQREKEIPPNEPPNRLQKLPDI